MVQNNWRGPVVDEYEFDICAGCSFYPCEYIGEFTKFMENHSRAPDYDSLDGNILLSEWDEANKIIKTVGATVVEIDGRMIEESTPTEVVDNRRSTGFLSYDRVGLQNGCIMGPRYVTQVECGRKSVADGIGDHYQVQLDFDYRIEENVPDRWEPKQPVVLSAQTGQGKNYFIENFLIPYLEDLNYKNKTKFRILIISNRLALKRQSEMHIRGQDNAEDNGKRVYSYKDVADVVTYQGLLRRKKDLERVQKKKRPGYLFVICDEAHFFTSDAMFNPYTQEILSSIVVLFKKAIRIYMTATPYECLQYICEHEEYPPVFYHFQRDYSYLNVKAYSEIRELYDDIIKGVNRAEKWLIFIDDKAKCQRVKNELEEKGEKMGISLQNDDSKAGKVYAVSADSKNDEICKLIVQEEKLVKGIQVLITTSVLDNGVNLTGIDHIVVADMSKSKCIQMVGRARKSGDNDSKTLYLKRFDKKYVADRIRDLKEQRKAYHDFDLAYGDLNDIFCSSNRDEYSFLCKYFHGNETDWKNANHWFSRSQDEPDKLFLNEIARSLLEKRLSMFEFILEEMAEEEKEVETSGQEIKRLPGQKYLEYQLSWFEKEYCADDDQTLCDKGKTEKNFLDFLKLYSKEKRCIDNKEKEGFRKEFTRLHDAAFPREDKNKDRAYGISKMNSILEKQKMNYKIESKSEYWTVVEYNRNPTIQK